LTRWLTSRETAIKISRPHSTTSRSTLPPARAAATHGMRRQRQDIADMPRRLSAKRSTNLHSDPWLNRNARIGAEHGAIGPAGRENRTTETARSLLSGDHDRGVVARPRAISSLHDW